MRHSLALTGFALYNGQSSENTRKNPAGRCRRKYSIMESELKYEMILYWSSEDEAFIADVPELPGCSTDGATYQEAVANAQRVVREWIETASELGRAIPKPRGRPLYA